VNKNVRNGIVLGILALVLIAFLYKNFMTESPEEREFRERLEAAQEAREKGQAPPAAPGRPSAPAAGGAAAPATPAAAPGGQQLDLDELAAGIKEVEFNYQEAREQEQLRNPMTPLVGPYVAQARPGEKQDGQEASPTSEAAVAAIRRNLNLTGIMWHPTDPIAILNNEIVPLGYAYAPEAFQRARFGGSQLEAPVTVQRMTKDSVILKYKDSEITLELKER
jgi:hypothetical protein